MIKDIFKNLVASLIVTVLVMFLQVAIQAGVIAYLYSDLILPPAKFASRHMYDGFIQVYFYLQSAFSLPPRFHEFIGQGVVSKLFLLPEFVAVDTFLAPWVVVGLALVATVSRRWQRRPLGSRMLPMLSLLLLCEAGVHLYAWLSGVHVGQGAGSWHTLQNYLRNFVYGGTFLASGVLLLTTAVSVGLVRSVRDDPVRTTAAAVASTLIACLAVIGPGIADAGFPGSAGTSQSSRRALVKNYNVILISIDSLRADHTSAYGYRRDTTPTLQSLAAAGVRFENTSSTTSWTLPAHMSMLTGRSLLGHGVIADDRALTGDVPTLAQSFQAAGYTTKAITSAPYLEHRFGFDHGFDDYDDQTVRFDSTSASYQTVTAPLVQKTAAKWLTTHRNQQFFLFLHYWDVHYDYAPGPPYDTMFDPDYRGSINGDNFYFNPAVNKSMKPEDLAHVVALYDGEIRLVDDHLAALLRTLGYLGLSDKTIIVVTADHGDEFFEHGHKGHHRTLYEEVLHVPLVLYVPGLEPTERRVTMETSIVDIMPTLLSIVGIEIPKGVEGVDMSSVAYRGDSEWDRSTEGELYRRGSLNVQVSLQNERTKIIEEFYRLQMHSYDLTLDPGEHTPRATHIGFATALASELTGWLNGEWRVFRGRIDHNGVNHIHLDAGTRERLRALGYADD